MPHSARVSVEDLIAHRAWVRTLARSLVRDENEADDLEQDAWVRALESPPQSAGSLRGWFAAVLRTRNLDVHRSRTRRAGREATAARREDPVSPEELAARTESHRDVVDAVLRLPEAYRDVVLLCYFEGLTPTEAGAARGVPASTIRTRLQRALTRLRDDLDGRHGGERGTWLTALTLLARPERDGKPAPTRPLVLRWVLTLSAVLVVGAATLLAAGALDDELHVAGPNDNGEHVATAEPAGPETRDPARRVGRAARPVEDRADDERAPPDTTDDAASDAARAATFEPLPVAADGEVIVRVVDAVTREPAVGARVRTRETDDTASVLQRSEVFDQLGDELITDARGEVRLRESARTRALAARAGRLESRDVVPAGRCGPLTLALRTGRDLSVHVTTSDGSAAAGVVAQLVAATPWGPEVVVESVTGDGGIARLRDTAARADRYRGWEMQVFVAASASGVRIDPGHLPDAPIEIRIGAATRAVIAVTLGDGAAAPDGTLVELRPSDGGGVLQQVTRDGRAAFDRIARDRRWTATAQDAHGRFVSQSAQFDTSPDGTDISAQLTLGEPRARVVGHVVDPEGRAVPRLLLDVRAAPSEGSPASAACWTGDDGRFALALDVSAARLAGALLRVVERRPFAADARELVALRPAEVSADSALDLGDIVRTSEPVIARGRVVGDDASPLEGAVVTLIAGADGCEAGAVTDAEGRFELAGRAPLARAASAWVQATGWLLAAPATLRPGAPAEIVLERAGAVAGSVDLGPTHDARELFVSVEFGGVRVPVAIGPAGGFECDTCRAGTCTLRVLSTNRRTPLAVVENVEVRAGFLTRDPRLVRIRLDGSGAAFSVLVADADGASLPGAVVWTRGRAAGGTWASTVTDSSGVAVTGAASGADVVVIAPGFRTHRSLLAAGRTCVSLAPASADEVSVSVAGDVLRDAATHVAIGDTIVVRAHWLGPVGAARESSADGIDALDFDPPTAPLDTAGRATLRLADQGRYELTLWSMHHTEDEHSEDLLAGAPAGRIDVSGTGRKMNVSIH